MSQLEDLLDVKQSSTAASQHGLIDGIIENKLSEILEKDGTGSIEVYTEEEYVHKQLLDALEESGQDDLSLIIEQVASTEKRDGRFGAYLVGRGRGHVLPPDAEPVLLPEGNRNRLRDRRAPETGSVEESCTVGAAV